MPVFPDMPAEEYHGIAHYSARMTWDIIGPDGCLALAWHRCPWLNPAYEPEADEIMENGIAVHAATFEPEEFEKRITIIDAADYRTQKARDLRDDARANGMIPILYDRGPGAVGPSFVKIQAIRKALEESEAAPLLFGPEGRNEISYTWELPVGDVVVPCKARADRIVPETIIDLKSAPTASPEGFQRSMVNYGHHARAAFYLDGWSRQDYAQRGEGKWSYVFVVVQKEPPYLTSVYRATERALEWGDKLNTRALKLYAEAITTHHWPAFAPASLDLPVWAEHRLADLEANERL